MCAVRSSSMVGCKYHQRGVLMALGGSGGDYLSSTDANFLLISTLNWSSCSVSTKYKETKVQGSIYSTIYTDTSHWSAR